MPEIKICLIFLISETSRFDRLGCFPYFHEEHAPAFALKDTLSTEEKQERVAEIMELQEEVSEEKSRVFEGTVVKVLIDQIEGESAFGRTEYDAPEVDNDCILTVGDTSVNVGSFYMAKITDTNAFELHGSVVV